MLTNKEVQVFESVARGNPQFVEYLRAQLQSKKDLLVTMTNDVALRQIQGQAQCLQTLLDGLDQATGSPRRRAGSST